MLLGASLPLWLGWEIWNLLSNTEAGIGFDAHAGGLVCGALLGGALVLARQTRADFMDDDAPASAHDERWEQALQHMGRFENAAAERLLAELAAEQPQRLEVVLARWRVARNAGKPGEVRARALEAVQREATDTASLAAQREVIASLLDDALLTQWQPLFERSLAAGWLQEAEVALAKAPLSTSEDVAQAWLRLALRHGERNDLAQQRRLLARLEQDYPQTPQAGKARFLLENG